MKKVLKKFWLVGALLLTLSIPLTVGAATECAAFATMCYASCYIQAPPGGSVSCHNCPDGATCTAFDANGGFFSQVWDTCAPRW